MTGTQPEASTSSKREWRNYRVTVEPVMMVAFYLVAVSGSPLTDLVIRQSCRQLHMDVENCTNDEAMDEEVHRTSSTFSMWRIVIDTLPGCLMSLFLSPWCDTNGRKPVIIVTLVGTALSHASLSYMSTIPDLHPYVLLASGIPQVVSGGTMLLILNSFCYITDITNLENRVIRFAIAMTVSGIGGILAQFAAPLLERWGYDWVFATNTILTVITTLYVIILLPESVKVVEEKKEKLFTMDHLVVSFHTFFKKRPNHGRGILFCLLIGSCTALLIASGESEVKYLSTIKKFGWTIEDYSKYTAVSLIATAVGTLSGVYLGLRVLKMTEQMFCVVLTGLLTISTLWNAWSTSPEEFYIVSLLKTFSSCVAPVVKSSMSKVVPLNEVSKVIAFQSSAEAFMPQLGAVLYSRWYNIVIGFDVFAVYYLSTLLCVVGLLCYTLNMILYHKGKWHVDGTSGEVEKDMKNNEMSINNTVADVEDLKLTPTYESVPL